MSCIDGGLDYNDFNPNDMLDNLRRKVCRAIKDINIDF